MAIPAKKKRSKMPAPKTRLADLVEELGKARKASSDRYETYKEAKTIEDNIRAELEVELMNMGLKSAKGEDFTASITETPRIVIKNESAVMAWLKEAPDIEYDHYVGIKATEFQSLAKSLLKGTGEVIEGTAIETKQFLSIRSNSKKKEA